MTGFWNLTFCKPLGKYSYLQSKSENSRRSYYFQAPKFLFQPKHLIAKCNKNEIWLLIAVNSRSIEGYANRKAVCRLRGIHYSFKLDYDSKVVLGKSFETVIPSF